MDTDPMSSSAIFSFDGFLIKSSLNAFSRYVRCHTSLERDCLALAMGTSLPYPTVARICFNSWKSAGLVR